MFSGCKQEDLLTTEAAVSDGPRFHGATEEFNADTKTALGQNNSVVWSLNDELAIFASSTKAGKYRVTDESAGSTNGEFEYVPVGGNFVSGTEIETNVAIYPYEDGLICSNGEGPASYVIGNVTLPEIQHYVEDSFPEESFPMVAVTRNSADMVLNFKNTGGAVRLLLKGTASVRTIEFSGNDGEPVAGDCEVTVYMDGSVPSVRMSDNALTSITLDCGEGVQLDEETATQFMLSLPPTEFRNGFTITVTDTEGGTATLKATKANTVNRSRVLNMPELKITTKPGTVDLSANGTANSYIVQKSGTYRFRTVKGNSQESAGTATSAETVWTTFCTKTAPVEGDLIRNPEYSDGYITFTVPEPFMEGNAVIAAKDADGTILWSWHIWMVEDQIEEHTYANDAGVMMDRNLGAISATIEDNGSLGLMYQWGRKDPIIGAYQILNEKDIARSYGREWTYVKSDATTGTIGYAVQNPTTFIIKSSSSNDWLYGTHDSTRWGSEKTIYDPCPPGWRVPDGGPDGFWDKAGLTRQITGNRSGVGMIVPVTYCSSESWWPAIGRYTTTIESLSSIKNYGYYWTASSKSEKEAYRFSFQVSGYGTNRKIDPILPSGSNMEDKSYGHCVRCCKE